jgi:hypothetical protein
MGESINTKEKWMLIPYGIASNSKALQAHP